MLFELRLEWQCDHCERTATVQTQQKILPYPDGWVVRWNDEDDLVITCDTCSAIKEEEPA